MKVFLSLLTAAGLAISSAAVATEPTKTDSQAPEAKQTGEQTVPGQKAGQETSDRTPGEETTTPEAQTTQDGSDTSDRTPSSANGAGDGEMDSGMESENMDTEK